MNDELMEREVDIFIEENEKKLETLIRNIEDIKIFENDIKNFQKCDWNSISDKTKEYEIKIIFIK